MALKKIIIKPKDTKLFFSVDIYDANGAYSWEYIVASTGFKHEKGKGNSKKHEVIPLKGTDVESIGRALRIKFANDELEDAYTRISIFQGTDPDHLTLLETYELAIPENPTIHQINFVKELV